MRRRAGVKNMSDQILVVDDEKEIADLIELYLMNEGYEIHKCYDGASALRVVREQKLDLAILDVMLPDTDGFTLCKMIREHHNYPIIMLTAKIEDVDKIRGLTIGADDYITKPFNPLEVIARVKAQLRRYKSYNDQAQEEAREVYEVGGLVIDNERHECTLYGKPIALTPIEFKILWTLCENDGKVVSSEQLFETVWGEEYLDCNNTVMVHIRRLREKLGERPRNPKYIKTVWGVGYKIEK